MSIPKPDHYFDQAERLASPVRAGAPRQVDLRRSISAAYYGLFHFVIAWMTDVFVGGNRRGSLEYSLVYRRVEHSTINKVCEQFVRKVPEAKYKSFLSDPQRRNGIEEFARVFVDLQQRRHQADYDPLAQFYVADATAAVSSARNAVESFKQADPNSQRTFVILILCPPR